MKQELLNRFVKENLDPMRKIAWNSVKFSSNFTPETMKTTVAVALWAWQHDYQFATEAYMKNGCRADVLIPDFQFPIIEIVDSETEESLSNKRRKYEEIGLWFLEVPADPVRAVAILEKETP